MALSVSLGLLALVLVVRVVHAERTCSELVEKMDKLNATEQRNAQLCQLLAIADYAKDTTKTLLEGLATMLDDQGVKIYSDQELGTSAMSKRKTEFLRFGKRDLDEAADDLGVQKRKTEFLRFGKRQQQLDDSDSDTGSDVVEKRKTEFLRFGKRPSDADEHSEDEIDLKKRKTEFLRFGKKDGDMDSEDGGPEMEKRKTEFLRFGKRKTEFLRFGKRKTEFLRFGKRS